jgi:bacillithiol biosynthesis deacetylase BshB1
LAFAAHPDDVELFCSGLLIKLQKQGKKTGAIDLTRGELSSNGTPQIRGQETKQATKIMKLSVRENLDMEDGNIENSKKNRLKIIQSIRKYKPDLVLIPYWLDRHPDHFAASRLVSEASYYAGLKKIETDQEEHRPQFVLHYMMHQTFTPSFIIDISEEMEEKIQSIKCYKSQFGKSANKTFINRPEFFDSIINRAKFYGYEIKKEFGEPYFFNGVLRVNNIFEFLS